MKIKFLAIVCMLYVSSVSLATENASTSQVIRIALSDGQVAGQVFAMLDEIKAPLVGKVSLTDSNGKTISTLKTDESGKFAFKDIKPGSYKAIGVAGDYVGDTDIEVVAVTLKESESTSAETEFYTAIPLAVAPAPSTAIFEAYAGLPAASFSAAPSFSLGGGVGGGVGYGGVSGGSSFGGSCGCGGGFNFRRLALIGGAIALPIALSGGGDDMATPDE